MGATSNQTLKRKDSEMFLTRSEEILSTDKCSQSMEVEANLMQNELNMLSMLPFSSANNALNVNKFLTDIEAGPYYICKSCNRTLYRKSVRKFHRDAYSIEIITDVPHLIMNSISAIHAIQNLSKERFLVRLFVTNFRWIKLHQNLKN